MIATVNTETGEFSPETGERSKENKNFVMLYRQFIQQVADLGAEDPQALRVLLFLVRHMDNRNALIVPMQLIADMLKLSRQTVSSKIKYLYEGGWIDIYKAGRSNVYIVNPEFVWTAYADERSYCKFESTVMLSNTDQWNMPRRDSNRIKSLEVLKELADKYEQEDTSNE